MSIHIETFSYYTKIKERLFREKEYILISAVFFSFFLLLTPLGVFSNHIPKKIDEGFFSIVRFDISGDDGGHYDYLRSLFFDHDIDFINEPFSNLSGVSKETGYIYNLYPIGTSILWFPFFIIGHILACLMYGLGLEIGIDGYSFPYITMIALGTMCYGYLGTLFCYKSLCLLFDKKISIITTISAIFSSTFLYWFYIRPFMDITLDFFNLSLFIYIFLIYIIKPPQKRLFYLFFGIAGGLMSITRFNGVVYLSSLSFFLIVSIFQKIKNKETDQLIDIVKNFILFLLGFFIAISPQLIVQNVLNGSYLDPGPVLAINFSSIHPSIFIHNFINIFFGKTGLFFQCPIHIVGLLGFLLMFFGRYKDSGKMRLFYLSLLVSFILQVILVARLTDHSGNAYGIRYLAPSILIFVFGIANMLKHLKISHIIYYWILGFFLISWQYIQIIEYRITIPYNLFSISSVLRDFLTKIIDHNPSLLLRSSNFLKLMIQGHLHLDSVISFYFIVIIPLILLTVVSCMVFIRRHIFQFASCRVTSFILFFLIIFLDILLLMQPRINQEEINKRVSLYTKLQPVKDKIVMLESGLWDYRLGLIKKDKGYVILSKLKNYYIYFYPWK